MKPFDFSHAAFWLSRPRSKAPPRAVKDRCWGPQWSKKRAAVERIMDGVGVPITAAYLAARLGVSDRTARRYLLTGVDAGCFEMIKPTGWPSEPAVFVRGV